MTIVLDEAMRIGETTIAAIVYRSTSCQDIGVISCQAAKHPVAILVRQDDMTIAFDLDGSPIAEEDIEKRFPCLLKAFMSLASCPS